MSYEGVRKLLCANGHLSIYDCYAAPSDEDKWRCPYCKAKATHCWSVEQTNYIPVGDIELKQIEPATCAFCGLPLKITPAVYEYIPTSSQSNKSN